MRLFTPSSLALVFSIACTRSASSRPPSNPRAESATPQAIVTPPPENLATPETPVTPPPSPSPPSAPSRYEGTFPGRAGRFRAELRVAGLTRSVHLSVPERRDEHPPLVVLLHGTGANGEGITEECGAHHLAENEHVIVAAPDARDRDGSDWDHPESSGGVWWETHPDHDPNHNPDLLLVRAVMDEALRAYRVDPRRVYVMGHSNGAFFTLVVAMTLGDRVAAFVTNSGGLVRCPNTPACHFRAGRVDQCERYASMRQHCSCNGPPLPIAVRSAGRHAPFLLVHGTNDETVSVQYTCDLAAALRENGHAVELSLRPGEGHYCDGDFATNAWAFLSRHRLP